MRSIYSVTLILFSVLTALAQSHEMSALSSTAGGKRVIAYFDAYNSDDESRLRSYFLDNIATEALKQRPVERRLEFHRQVKADHGVVKLSRVVSVSDAQIKVVGRSAAGGTIEYTFDLSPDADRKIVGMGIEPKEEQDGDSTLPSIPAPATAADLPAAIEALFDVEAKADRFSGVVLVAKDGKPMVSKAYGLADSSTNAANRNDTKFNLGSINKMFTRIAIGQLVKQGKVSFDDKLIKILPDYPNKAAADKITVGQLVTMTSGIGDIFNERWFAGSQWKVRHNKDYLPFFADRPLEFEPGTRNLYSNGGYVVLGLIIEKVSGKSYYDFVRENIFAPAGMKDTDSYEIDKLPPNTAIGYMKKGGARVPNAVAMPGRGSSAGGGYSTAGDLLKFVAALKDGKLLIPTDAGQMPTEFTGVGIAGGSEGVNGLLLSNAKTGYTVIVLSNFDPPSAERPGLLVRDWLKQLKQ